MLQGRVWFSWAESDSHCSGCENLICNFDSGTQFRDGTLDLSNWIGLPLWFPIELNHILWIQVCPWFPVEVNHIPWIQVFPWFPIEIHHILFTIELNHILRMHYHVLMCHPLPTCLYAQGNSQGTFYLCQASVKILKDENVITKIPVIVPDDFLEEMLGAVWQLLGPSDMSQNWTVPMSSCSWIKLHNCSHESPYPVEFNSLPSVIVPMSPCIPLNQIISHEWLKCPIIVPIVIYYFKQLFCLLMRCEHSHLIERCWFYVILIEKWRNYCIYWSWCGGTAAWWPVLHNYLQGGDAAAQPPSPLSQGVYSANRHLSNNHGLAGRKI